MHINLLTERRRGRKREECCLQRVESKEEGANRQLYKVRDAPLWHVKQFKKAINTQNKKKPKRKPVKLFNI